MGCGTHWIARHERSHEFRGGRDRLPETSRIDGCERAAHRLDRFGRERESG